MFTAEAAKVLINSGLAMHMAADLLVNSMYSTVVDRCNDSITDSR